MTHTVLARLECQSRRVLVIRPLTAERAVQSYLSHVASCTFVREIASQFDDIAIINLETRRVRKLAGFIALKNHYQSNF